MALACNCALKTSPGGGVGGEKLGIKLKLSFSEASGLAELGKMFQLCRFLSFQMQLRYNLDASWTKLAVDTRFGKPD